MKSIYKKEQERFEDKIKRVAAEREKLHKKTLEEIKNGNQKILEGGEKLWI